MEEKYQLGHDEFETWRGDFEQVDDECVIGEKIWKEFAQMKKPGYLLGLLNPFFAGENLT